MKHYAFLILFEISRMIINILYNSVPKGHNSIKKKKIGGQFSGFFLIFRFNLV